ncbi:MAG TPA: hypothetical protein VM870_09970 [Pyrinomonadaceae bacterium]|nr:hypothetical protein [Pyrinomonadaceae bacterium]
MLTVWSRLVDQQAPEHTVETPLVSVLRDTLGDDVPENDRLRYVWMLTYTRPTLKQQAAASVPFFYRRVSSRKDLKGMRMPPPIIDLAATDREVWQRLFFDALKFVVAGDPVVRASVNTYRRNVGDYRKAHIIRALAVLSLYQSQTGAPSAFTPGEMAEIQSRLLLTEKTLGGLVQDEHLQSYYLKQTSSTRDMRGHNWELLRQRCEAENLFFEPLELPDGSATHALVWVARPQLTAHEGGRFDSRFLNVKNPWQDESLRRWRGYTEVRYFDADNRPVAPDAAGARPVEMIPLALYGLDYPKIPALLVDFRDNFNPKRREISRRLLDDVARNVLQTSRFGDLYYFLGRTVFDFVTDRRGMDLNQPSRLRAYSQLKLLLSLSESIKPELREQVDERLERVSANPLENDANAERQLALSQYKILITYAERADGLGARLDRDRRAELVNYAHGTKAKIFFRAANIVSFGLYTHREDSDFAKLKRLDAERQLAYHRRFLREVLKSSPVIEVVWKIEDVRRSLRFLAAYDSANGEETVRLTAQVFAQTQDSQTKELCLENLRRSDSVLAKNELRRLDMSEQTAAGKTDLSAKTGSQTAPEDEPRATGEGQKISN